MASSLLDKVEALDWKGAIDFVAQSPTSWWRHEEQNAHDGAEKAAQDRVRRAAFVVLKHVFPDSTPQSTFARGMPSPPHEFVQVVLDSVKLLCGNYRLDDDDELEVHENDMDDDDDDDDREFALLCSACQRPNVDVRIVRLFIEAFPRTVREKCQDRKRFILPLHIAILRSNSAEVVSALLDGCPEAAKCTFEMSGCPVLPLHLACRRLLQHSSSKAVLALMIQRLLRAYPEAAQVTNEAERWNLPLHRCCQALGKIPPNMDPRTSLMETLQKLLEAYPAATRMQNDYGSTPLHLAAHVSEAAQILITADPKAARMKDSSGYLPLHNACQRNNGKCMVQLLEVYPDGASVRATPELGRNKLPIHLVMGIGTYLYRSPSKEMDAASMKRLIEAYPDGVRTPPNLPFQEAVYACFEEGDEDEPSDCYGRLLRFDSVREVLRAYPDALFCLDHHATLQNGMYHFIQRMSSWDVDRWTEAAYPKGAVECFTWKDASANAPLSGLPIHHICQYSKHSELLPFLRSLHGSFGEGVQTRDSLGRLPLHVACSQHDCCMEFAQKLVDFFGPALYKVDKSGRLAVHCAFECDEASVPLTYFLLRQTPEIVTSFILSTT